MLYGCTRWHEAVQLDFDAADVLHGQHKTVKLGIVVQFAAITVGILQPLEAVVLFETRITRRVTFLETPEEVTNVFFEQSQDVKNTGGFTLSIYGSILL